MRAAEMVLAALRTKFGVHLRLEKKIPVGGGLGGGSADAAAALEAVNALAGNVIPRAELLQFAAKLGSDVAFCFSGASLALGWSRGERLMVLPPLPPAPVLLLVPPVSVKTAEAYRWVAEARKNQGRRGAVAMDLELSGDGAASGGSRETTSNHRSSPSCRRSAPPSRRWWGPSPWCAGCLARARRFSGFTGTRAIGTTRRRCWGRNWVG